MQCECPKDFKKGTGIGVCRACGGLSCNPYFGCWISEHGNNCRNRKESKI